MFYEIFMSTWPLLVLIVVITLWSAIKCNIEVNKYKFPSEKEDRVIKILICGMELSLLYFAFVLMLSLVSNL